MFKKVSFIALLSLIFASTLFGQEVSLEIPKANFSVGELVSLQLKVESEHSFQSLSFDLEYSGDLLTYVGYEYDGLTNDDDVKLLFAQAESTLDQKKRLVYSIIWPEEIHAYQKSNVLSVKFRVQAPFENEQVTFQDAQMATKGLEAEVVTLATTFVDSAPFSGETDARGSYIWIKNPEPGMIQYDRNITMDVINTKGAGYKVALVNDTRNFETLPWIPADQGFANDIPMLLQDGNNTISAILYDENDVALAIKTANYRFENHRDTIRILSPENYTVVNESKVTIAVSSSHDTVRVNGLSAIPQNKFDSVTENPIYHRDIVLKEGFNEIEVIAETSGEGSAKETMVLYFEQADSLFAIVEPYDGQWMKYPAELGQSFFGEISHMYAEDGQKNEVIYDITFDPSNPYLPEVPLVQGKIAEIKPVDKNTIFHSAEGEKSSPRTPFYFSGSLSFEEALGSGTLIITAFLNHNGVIVEDTATSSITLDDRDLQIILNQPNLYTDDHLTNLSAINDFHHLATAANPDWENSNMEITPSGNIQLKKSDNKAEKWNDPFPVAPLGIKEDRNGTLYAFFNDNGAHIWSKTSSSTQWQPISLGKDLHIYDLEVVDGGLLLGVSHYNFQGKTGLYYYDFDADGSKLKNILLSNELSAGMPILNVQFVDVRNNQVTIYGNDYPEVIQFRIDSLYPHEERADSLKVGYYKTKSLINFMPLRDVQFSATGQTAVLTTINDEVRFYSLNGNDSYELQTLGEGNGYLVQGTPLYGEYRDGEFDAWLIDNDSQYSVVMEKKGTGQLSSFTLAKSELTSVEISAVTFADNAFYFLSRNGSQAFLQSAKVYFDRFMDVGLPQEFPVSSGLVSTADTLFKKSSLYGFLFGDGTDTQNHALLSLMNDFKPSGSLSFSHANPDSEYTKGFSFVVPAIWYESDDLKLDFEIVNTLLYEEDGKLIGASDLSYATEGFSNGPEKVNLKTWIEQLSQEDNIDAEAVYSSINNAYTITIDFSNLYSTNVYWGPATLNFEINLTKSRAVTPSLGGLVIHKKVPLKVPTDEDGKVVLPISGFVTDPRVDTVTINSTAVPVNPFNLSFQHDLSLNLKVGDELVKRSVTIKASADEEVTVDFEVHPLASENGLANVEFHSEADDTLLDFQNGAAEVFTPGLSVSGDYYGLNGALVGYEIWNQDNSEILKRGLLEVVEDTGFDTDQWGEGKNTNQLTSGSFTAEENLINLLPGEQIVKIFVENPGGKKSYFISEKSAKVHYVLSQDEQRIFLTNREVVDLTSTDQTTYEGGRVLQSLGLLTQETDATGQAFESTILLQGQVYSLDQLDSIKVKGNSTDVRINGESGEQIIELNNNRFEFALTIKTPEAAADIKDYYVSMTPTAPFQIGLKSVLKVTAERSYEGANIIPDFSLMDWDNSENPWTEEERKALAKPIKVRFSRRIPSGAKLILTVNFEEYINGTLVKDIDGNWFNLEQDGELISLRGLKSGVNRIRWSLKQNSAVISSSSYQLENMEDYILWIDEDLGYEDTVFSFEYATDVFYSVGEVPNFSFSKDSFTNLTLRLNGATIANHRPEDAVSSDTIDLNALNLAEGMNEIEANFFSPIDEPETQTWLFYYDSKDPLVGDPWYKVNDQGQFLEIGVTVQEGNLKSLKLYRKNGSGGEDKLNLEPQIIPLGEGYFQGIWTDLNPDDPMLVADPDVGTEGTGTGLYIRAEDKAEKWHNSKLFYNPSEIVDNVVDGEVILLEENNINGQLWQPYYLPVTSESEKQGEDYRNFRLDLHNDFPRYWVIKDETPVYDGTFIYGEEGSSTNIADHYLGMATGQRHFDISNKGFSSFGNITNTFEVGNHIALSSEAGLSVQNGFILKRGQRLTLTTGIANSDARNFPALASQFHKSYTNYSLNFQIRYEDGAMFTLPAGLTEEYKEIITLLDNGTDKVSLLYKKDLDTPETAGLFFLHESDGFGEPVDLNLELNQWTWQSILINVAINENDQNEPPTFTFWLDGQEPVNPVQLQPITGLLTQDSQFYFGSLDPNEAGNFAIAQAFYVDRVISSSDLVDYIDNLEYRYQSSGEGTEAHDFGTMDLEDLDQLNAYRFGFDLEGEELKRVGPEFYNLRLPENKPEDNPLRTIVSTKEDSKYSSNGSALIVAPHIRNYLEDRGNEIVFHDADGSVTSGLSVSSAFAPGTNAPSIYLDLDAGTGRYIFGNVPTNHGLTTDKYYSISGTIAHATKMPGEDLNAKLYLLFNGKETLMPLKVGDFHFVIPNSAQEVPKSVVMYIDTKENIYIHRDMQVVEGNGVLPPEVLDYTDNYASTWYPFNKAGTVYLDFKPFMVNQMGEVDYTSVILDSPHMQIKTYRDQSMEANGKSRVFYQAWLYVDGVQKILKTHVPVVEGWHSLRLTWSEAEGTIRFYVDGLLAAETTATNFDGMIAPTYSDSDNLLIGRDVAGLEYAYAFIDQLKITSLFEEFKETAPAKPLTMEYQTSPGQAGIKVAGAMAQYDIDFYRIQDRSIDPMMTKDHSDGSDIVFDTDMPTGYYLIRAEGVHNGKRLDEQTYFIYDEKPYFPLVEAPLLTIKDEPEDLTFKVAYDGAFALEDESDRYAALGIEVTGEYDNNAFKKVIYLTQDFTKQDRTLWQAQVDGSDWEAIEADNGVFTFTLPGVVSSEPIVYGLKALYFTQEFNTSSMLSFDEQVREVPQASFKISKPTETVTVSDGKKSEAVDFEYKIHAELAGQETVTQIDIDFSNFSLKYRVLDHGSTSEVILPFPEGGKLDIYYDDILADYSAYGTYNVQFDLIYQGVSYQSSVQELNWKEITDAKVLEDTSSVNLKISDFSLLYTDVDDSSDTIGNFYVKYETQANYNLFYDLYVNGGAGEEELVVVNDESLHHQPVTSEDSSTSRIFYIEDIPLRNGVSELGLRLYIEDEEGVLVEDYASTQVTLDSEAPEIFFTNTVPFFVPYNSMQFTWLAYVNDKTDGDILYSYNLDGKDWTEWQKNRTSLELYNLQQGEHILRVKAKHNEKESTEVVARFLVDTEKPVLDQELISFTENRDEDGILQSVSIVGEEGAIADQTLVAVTVNDIPVTMDYDGSFDSGEILIDQEGLTSFSLKAYDRVGKVVDATYEADNSFVTILSPSSDNVRFSPVTLVGQLAETVYQDVEISLQNPLDAEDWIVADINADRVFFMDDIRLRPGSADRAVSTSFTLRFKLDDGRIYYKDLKYDAGNLIRPIELNLSQSALQGQGEPNTIAISAYAAIDNLASWSIDFDGDGNYDDITMANALPDPQRIDWTHKYSTITEVEPRVRVITNAGEYFSVTETLVIHEEIKSASVQTVENAIAFDMVYHEEAGSESLYVLKGEKGNYSVVRFDVDRNQDYLSNPRQTILLNNMVFGTPEGIVSISDTEMVIRGVRGSEGYLSLLLRNEQGNFELAQEVILATPARSLAYDRGMLFAALDQDTANPQVVTVDKYLYADGAMILDSKVDLNANEDGRVFSNQISLESNHGTLYVLDRLYQKVHEYTQNLEFLTWWGSFGDLDKEFMQPSIIQSFGDRLYIYDLSREDIQVFQGGPDKLVTKVAETGDYLPAGFFQGISSLGALGRVSGNVGYQYLAALNPASETLALVKMPQWVELRASTRNNQIVFLKDRELYTAKPDGSDLGKRLTTDSLPLIDGNVDYPTLSPDGRRLAFVSRRALYTGEDRTTTENDWAYDVIYLMEHGNTIPRVLNISGLESYEIERPVFSSNGDRIAFSAKKGGDYWQIYEYHWETGLVTKLFDANENIRYPYYSPDDRFVVYTTDYDGDQDIEIYDSQNPDIRVTVTKNDARDSYPVWSRVYPHEAASDSDIESKIAFVSERDFTKQVYYSYISRPSDSDLRIVTVADQDVGSDPDTAALPVSPEGVQTDYPAYTGDGTSLVYESFDGKAQSLFKFDQEGYKSTQNAELEDYNDPMELPYGAERPAGMKNTITEFRAEVVNGNEVQLNWTPYTDHDIFYILQYKPNSGSLNYTEKKVYSQDGTRITGLDMNKEYLFHLVIEENERIAAETQWLKVKVPEVVARPSFTIDEENPYLVKLEAWKPDEDTMWRFSWIIDNQEIATAHTSTDYYYEFATSGPKTIQLKATNSDATVAAISEPIVVNIVSDIHPSIEANLVKGPSPYLDLDATGSLGNRIDLSSAVWTITGPGNVPTQVIQGSQATVSVAAYQHKVNVNLRISRTPITGQQSTDTIEHNTIVDLDYDEIKPVVTYIAAEDNDRLLTFNGSNSLGNIDWRTSRWNVFADGQLIHQETGVSSFSYFFPEASDDTPYAISLTVGDASSGQSKTVTQQVTVAAVPMQPVVTWEVLELRSDDETIGTKVVLSAVDSKGNNIDHNLTEWNLPLAATYGEQPKQKGPTAIFNLRNPGNTSSVDVSLTLMRRGGIDATTVTKTIPISSFGVQKPTIKVNPTYEKTSEGYVVYLDVLESLGTDFEWEKTEWLVNGQYSYRGPRVRIERPYSTQEQNLSYSVNLYRAGGEILTKIDEVTFDPVEVRPIISVDPQDGGDGRTFVLSVDKTNGFNIDWERTLWSIYDGNTNVIQKRGAQILHTFMPKEDAMGYPVMAEMYFKGDNQPFFAYKSVDIEGDSLVPVIHYDNQLSDYDDADGNGQVMTFSALASQGIGIDWNRAQWSFGDGTPAQYGATVQHKFPISSEKSEYTVSLTLTRIVAGGAQESATTFQIVSPEKDEIKPVIKAVLDKSSGTLILSADQSQGKGLLLDRAQWVFPGEGDQESFSRGKSSGFTAGMNSGLNVSNTNSFTAGTSAGGFAGIPKIDISATNSTTVGFSAGFNIGSSNNSNSNENFSQSNYHTGPIARRYINDFTITSGVGREKQDHRIMVSLFVYRMLPDGSVEGVTINEIIYINQELRNAGTSGVLYQ